MPLNIKFSQSFFGFKASYAFISFMLVTRYEENNKHPELLSILSAHSQIYLMIE
jgi:hypothetical protein